MKKILRYFGIGVLGVFIFVGVVFVLVKIGEVNEEEVFVPYLNETIPKLTSMQGFSH